MNSNGIALIVLARDADLTSLRSGDPEIYWSSAESYESSQGARSWYLRAVILSVANGAAVRFLGQWSVDGRTWNDFVANLDGLRATPTPDYFTSTGNVSYQYVGTPVERAAFVRFGIEVSSTGSDQARIRLSADVTAQAVVPPYLNTFASAIAIVFSTQTGQLLYTNGYKSGIFTCLVTAASGASVLTLQGSNDGTNFWDMGTFSFSGTGLQTPISVTLLPEYVRVYATTVTTSGTVTLAASLRPE
jgi:hypothetical protein